MISDMEQTKKQTHLKKPVDHARGWPLGVLLLLLAGAAVFFGLHPHYRYVSVFFAASAVLTVFLRKQWHLITAAGLIGLVAFLFSFGPNGYRWASLIPLSAAVLLLIFRFCPKPVRILSSVLAAAVAVLLLIAEIPIVSAAESEPDADADYVIVLGAAVYGEEPSITVKNRVKSAVSYLKKHPSSKAVASGGQGDGEDISEAECMRRLLVHYGIQDSRILMEDRSSSTMENLSFSKAVIESDGGSADKAVIVSSSYHLYRAKRMASSLGMQAYGLACSDGYPVYMCGMFLREALGIYKLWILGS